jgi:hypothetical protein
MKNGVLDIDHMMISVKNSQRAGETFERLGFTLTPRSALPGMSNRLICFPPTEPDRCNFVELLGFDDRAAAPAFMHDLLGDREGPVSMVMASRDARAAEQELRANGFDPYPARAFKRDWTLPSGEVISPEFVVCLLKPGESPLYWNIAQYVGDTPRHYHRPDFTTHPNTACAFTAVLAVADDPAAIARHYEQVWDGRVLQLPQGVVGVTLNRVTLRLMTPAQAAALYPGAPLPARKGGAAYLGAAIGFERLDVARAHVERAGVAHKPLAEGGLWLPPEVAHGCVVAYEEPWRDKM